MPFLARPFHAYNLPPIPVLTLLCSDHPIAVTSNKSSRSLIRGSYHLALLLTPFPAMVRSLYNLTTHPNLTPPSPTAGKEQTCYFTYVTSKLSDHWSIETRLSTPGISTNIISDCCNPLLAARVPLLTPSQTLDASRFLQIQTMASHQSQRSRRQPHQDVFELSDDCSSSRSSISSESSSRSSSARPRVCSRCQTNFGEFVSYSLNSYYCTRCAKIVGYS